MSNVVESVRDRLGAMVFAKVAGDEGPGRRDRIHNDVGVRRFHHADPIQIVHNDASMFIGGIRALLLQSLHPLAMAAVDQHSGFRGDPWGRLQRTSTFLAETTFGTEELAQRAVDIVHAVHKRVVGIAPDGRPYEANDPHLLLWVHIAEVDSFLAAHDRYGSRKLTPAQRDTYVAQTAHVARMLGAAEPPTTTAELADCLQRFRPELKGTPAARRPAISSSIRRCRWPCGRATRCCRRPRSVSCLPGPGCRCDSPTSRSPRPPRCVRPAPWRHPPSAGWSALPRRSRRPTECLARRLAGTSISTDPQRRSSSMSTITKSVDVDVDVTTAYNQWTQFETFPQFMDGVEEVRQIDDTHLHWVTKVGPTTREFDATVTEQHPDERVAWKSTDGPEHAGVVTFHRLGDNASKVTVQMDIDPDGFLENTADKTGVLDMRVQGDLDRFKKFIESHDGNETGAWRGDVS